MNSFKAIYFFRFIKYQKLFKFWFFLLSFIILNNAARAQSSLQWHDDPPMLSSSGSLDINPATDFFLSNGNLSALISVDHGNYLFGASISLTNGYYLIQYDLQNKIKKATPLNYAKGLYWFFRNYTSPADYTYIIAPGLDSTWCFNGFDTITFNGDQKTLTLIAYDNAGNFVNNIIVSNSVYYSEIIGFDQNNNPIFQNYTYNSPNCTFTVYSKDLSQILISDSVNTGYSGGFPLLQLYKIKPISNNKYLMVGTCPSGYDVDPTSATFILNYSGSSSQYYAVCDSSYHVLFAKKFPLGLSVRDITYFDNNELIFSGNYSASLTIPSINGNINLPYIPCSGSNQNQGFFIAKSDTSLKFQWAHYSFSTTYTDGGIGVIPQSIANNNSPKFTFDLYNTLGSYIYNDFGIGKNHFKDNAIIQFDTSGNCKYFGGFEEYAPYQRIMGAASMLNDSTLFAYERFYNPLNISLNEIPIVITHSNLNAGVVMAKYSLKEENNHLVTGKLIADLNYSLSEDSTDAYIPFRPIINLVDSSYTLSDNLGNYSLKVDTGNYSIASSNNTNFNSSTPTIYNGLIVDSISADTGKYFYFTPENTFYDLKADINAPSQVQPYTPYIVYLSIKNTGTLTTEAHCRFNCTGTPWSFISSSISPSLILNDTLNWDFLSIKPFETKTIALEIQNDSSLSIGDSIFSYFYVTTFPNLDNYNFDNLVDGLILSSGSYDPNEKQSNHPEFADIAIVDSSFEFNYSIRFQNTGNDTAYKVILIDTLDANLDLLTLRDFKGSHDFNAQLLYNKILKISFDNIMLPDSAANFAASNGFFSYIIKPKKPILLQENILNRASIFFDYNEPVITNTTTTTFVNYVGINELLNNQDFIIYPNPTNDFIVLETNNKNLQYQYYISDQIGKRIITLTNLKNNSNKISVANLKSGMYFITLISSDGNKSTKKFVKY